MCFLPQQEADESIFGCAEEHDVGVKGVNAEKGAEGERGDGKPWVSLE